MIFSKERPVKIVMIGAGGTGGHIAPHLYRLLYALERPVKFIICDGDIVEKKNLVRQNFTEADLSLNKARVVAERYSGVFGLETSYVPDFIESAEKLEELIKPNVWSVGEYSRETVTELVILIGAVDNNRSRGESHGGHGCGDDDLQHFGGGQQHRTAGHLLHQNGQSPLLSKAKERTASSMTEIKNVVSAKEFQCALEKVLKATPKKSRLYFLLEAHVSFDGNTCTLTCTDLEQWCQAVIPAQGGQCSFILKDSKKFLSACKYFSGDMELSYQEDDPPEALLSKQDLDGSLTVRCGSRELHQRVAAAGLFPKVPVPEAEHTYIVDSASLSRRFERIKYALADDPSRPCNQCVKFFDNRIGAVDGYRLAYSRDKSLCVDEPFFIPPAAMKLLPAFEGENCRLSVGERYAVFDSGSVRVITSMPKGEGLNFDAAIPKEYVEEHAVDIADFMENLRYLNEFIRYPGRESIRFDGGVLSVETINGAYSAKLKLADAPKTVYGFNGGYMLEGLKQFQTKKLSTVAMQTGGNPYAPIVLTDQDDLAMVLPMKLKKAA